MVSNSVRLQSMLAMIHEVDGKATIESMRNKRLVNSFCFSWYAANTTSGLTSTGCFATGMSGNSAALPH